MPIRQSAIAFLIALISLIIFVAPEPVASQSSLTRITGIVLDAQTNLPIANARVNLIAPINLTTTTDARGAFVLDVNVRAPHELATISVVAPGYGAWTMRDALLFPGIVRPLTIRLAAQDQTIEVGLPRALTGALPEFTSFAPRTPNYFSHDTPPLTIKVGITHYANCSDWIAAGKPVVRVDVIDFKTYVKNVLPNEWLASWGNDAPESLRAGAIAVKMFAWWRVNLGGVRPLGAEVVDNTCDQRYIANTNDPRTDAAIDATWEFLMRRNSQVVEIHYLATVAQCNASPYPPCMPQWGTYYDALSGMNWRAIAFQYYAPIQISPDWSFLPLVLR